MTKVGDRAGPGAGGCDVTPGGRALSHGLLGKLNTWPSTVTPATPSLKMKEQNEVRGRRESQAKARKNEKDVISAKAKQRLAKHVKYMILAHTKRSLEKCVKYLLSPPQKKGNDWFFLKH